LATECILRYQAQNGKLPKEDEGLLKEYNGAFERDYQKWYSESFAVIKQLAPDRIAEFEGLYKGEPKRRTIDAVTYNIQDWLNGIRSGENQYTKTKFYDDFAIVHMRYNTQYSILEAISQRFESTLFDIKQLVLADIFDSELDSARELVKHKFLRGAGAIAGVVLEKHLAQVASSHNATIRKQHPAISDLNEALKSSNIIDTPSWRFVQRLGDLRNLANHNKEREPTVEEMSELVDGVDKITKTLF
jgi:hypothetical protein